MVCWVAGVHAEERHWAYETPVRPEGPTDSSRGTVVDYFVERRLEGSGLPVQPVAPAGTRLRRLSLDLQGIPPSVSAVAAFESDPSEEAYREWVHRYLNSPEFGVQWARPWLDYARYADSHGYQRDDFREVWAYRDWVVDALNADMPYDQFSIHQLAGDLLPDATLESRIATGFSLVGPINVEAGTEPEESRVNQVFDRVNTVATIWLGTTMECAQCHDHKYDPFTMRDYYGMFAVFNNTDKEAERTNPDAPGSIQFSGTYMDIPPEGRLANESASSEFKTLVMRERETRRASFILERGDYRNPGEPIAPGVPESLHPMTVERDKGVVDRLDFARWLVAEENPLVARVAVNRVWQELFGVGLVATPEDFGSQGKRPSHPEALDWLAVEFMRNGWSLKKLIETIVLTETYQRASSADLESWEMDPSNRLLARGPRFRMSAEMIRDNALAISGLLSARKGGAPIRPFQPEGVWEKVGGKSYPYEVSPGEKKYRRGLYVTVKRGAPYPSLINFDADNRMTCRARRSLSNTPLQALTLMNDPVYVECAHALAARVLAETSGESINARIHHCVRLAVARKATPVELEALRRLYMLEVAANRARDDLEVALADWRIPPGQESVEYLAWVSVATAVLNLDVTITKG